MSEEDLTELFLVARLEEFFGDQTDPWGVGYSDQLLDDPSIEPISESYSGWLDANRTSEKRWTAKQHAGRILFLMSSPTDLATAIVLDSVCDWGVIYPEPVLIDGWHRYFAHRKLGSVTVPASFGGLVEFARYLKGERDDIPEAV